MKKFIISLLSVFMMTPLMAQDDMYFVPTKKNIEKELGEYDAVENGDFNGSSRSIDEYNRYGSFIVPVDSVGNDIIVFDGQRGVYPDSTAIDSLLLEHDSDFRFAQRMEHIDDYISNAYYSGYSDGYRDSWLYSSMWYDPWYYDRWYGIGYRHYGYYRPVYVSRRVVQRPVRERIVVNRRTPYNTVQNNSNRRVFGNTNHYNAAPSRTTTTQNSSFGSGIHSSGGGMRSSGGIRSAGGFGGARRR